jgi:hypothetical protein
MVAHAARSTTAEDFGALVQAFVACWALPVALAVVEVWAERLSIP